MFAKHISRFPESIFVYYTHITVLCLFHSLVIFWDLMKTKLHMCFGFGCYVFFWNMRRPYSAAPR